MEKKESIDIVGLLLLLWGKRKRIIINCSIAFVLAVVIAFSIPKKYTSTVVMAPEVSTGGGIVGSLGEIASMAGMNVGGLAGSEDALYPELYPQIISSTPFLMDVLSTDVVSLKGDTHTLYDYLSRHTKTPWWVKMYSVPIAFVKRVFDSEAELSTMTAPTEAYTMNLSKQQFSTLSKLEKSIAVNVDKGNYLVTINVSMQDRRIAAMVANVVGEKLTEYIEEYRSAKARKDLAYSEVLFNEAQAKYLEAQRIYANFVTLHQNVVNKMHQVEIVRLENELEMAFSIYSQVAQALEMARAKVQEDTPVCVVIEPAYVQIKASSPRKMILSFNKRE